MSLLDAIPVKWKVVLFLGGLLSYTAAIGATYTYTLSRGIELGQSRQKKEQDEAAKAAMDQAIKERDAAYAELQSIEDEINHAPESDNGPLPPVLLRQLERVHP